MFSSQEILSELPQDSVPQHFTLAEKIHPNPMLHYFLYKQGTPFEASMMLGSMPQTPQDYFELAQVVLQEHKYLDSMDSEMEDFYKNSLRELGSEQELKDGFESRLSNAEQIFFEKVKLANKNYQEQLKELEDDICDDKKAVRDKVLKEMLYEVNAAIEIEGKAVETIIREYQTDKNKLKILRSSHQMFRSIGSLESKSHLYTNLLLDAALAGHEEAGKQLQSHLQEIHFGKDISIFLPRKLLPSEIQRLCKDLLEQHEGNYYRATSAIIAKKVHDILVLGSDFLDFDVNDGKAEIILDEQQPYSMMMSKNL
jgi:G3E family GTPase